MTSLLQAYGHNRARQRERMGDLLEDMGNLQEEVGYRSSQFLYVMH